MGTWDLFSTQRKASVNAAQKIEKAVQAENKQTAADMAEETFIITTHDRIKNTPEVELQSAASFAFCGRMFPLFVTINAKQLPQSQ